MYYEDWENGETFVSRDSLGNPVDKRHPWNQNTIPKPQKPDHLLWKIVGGAALAVVGAGVIRMLPDIKRYIRMSMM